MLSAAKDKTVGRKISLIWRASCFPYCQTWIISLFLFSVTLAKTVISPLQMHCLSHLCCAEGRVPLQCGFLISNFAVNQVGGDYFSQQGLEWRIHSVWIRRGYWRTSALGDCLQSWDLQGLDKALLLSLPYHIYSDPSFTSSVIIFSLSCIQ